MLQECLKPLVNPSSTSVRDNVLLEYETALRLWKQGKIHIFPLFVGNFTQGGYRKFGGFANV